VSAWDARGLLGKPNPRCNRFSLVLNSAPEGGQQSEKSCWTVCPQVVLAGILRGDAIAPLGRRKKSLDDDNENDERKRKGSENSAPEI
jgi:hypothetical protein